MANIAHLIEQLLSHEQKRALTDASDLAEKLGVELYLVGGTVRDLMLGVRPVDIDVSMASASSEFPSALASELSGEIKARSQFGTYKLEINGAELDLAMTRKESYKYPGALPSVETGSIDDDLARRDFSINAMAASLNRQNWAETLDPFDGQSDVEKGIIRVLHDKSFIDDATRILRAIRYAGRLRFRLDEHTEQLIERDRAYLDTIKGDRIRHEFERIVRENEAVPILKMVRDMGILSAIYAPLSLDDAPLDRFGQALRDGRTENNLLLASMLGYWITPHQREELISRLNMDGTWAKVVRDTVSLKSLQDELVRSELRRSEIYETLSSFDHSALRGYAVFVDEPLISERIMLYLSELYRVRGHLDGDDIMDLGVPQGPQVGRLLREILMARLDGRLRTRNDEESFVRSQIQNES